MINIRTLRKINEGGGLTLKRGQSIEYKTGYQVATEGVECFSPEDAIKAVRAYRGDCGIWLENGIYYIDKSHRVSTKKEALKVGRACNQISIFAWGNKNKKLIYC